MLSKLRGSRTLRVAVSVFVSLVLVVMGGGVVYGANDGDGTMTVSPSTVTAVNTSGSSTRGFQATGGRI